MGFFVKCGNGSNWGFRNKHSTKKSVNDDDRIKDSAKRINRHLRTVQSYMFSAEQSYNRISDFYVKMLP